MERRREQETKRDDVCVREDAKLYKRQQPHVSERLSHLHTETRGESTGACPHPPK